MYHYKYPRPAVTVDALIYTAENNRLYILLIQRGTDPFKGKWAFPGGFIHMDELLEAACRRELKEETGLEVNEMKQFRAYDAIDRDPRQRTISVVFSAQLPEKEPVTGGDDASRARWFSVGELPELAFDHQQILDDFLSTA